MFVNCAAVSPFEWHPFSINLGLRDDYLSVHIRTLGDWTRQLKTVFSEVCQPPPNGKSGLLRADYLQGENNPDMANGNHIVIIGSFPRVLIDGPYGAPAQDYKKYEAMDEEENSLENGHGMSNTASHASPSIAQKKVSLHHAKNGVDIVSGTRVKSHFAKPNWRNVYKRIALNHPEAKVGVFYCGAPALTKELKQHALDFSHKTSTKFDFHKENF
ncbi:hypothetical protein HAX54_038351 [Datura stramonium]|uniref:FAD-binding FR-type domain-containing protein n=1 Tax=Datura stramonium TaxID=4076 RepID=A0ABS8SHV8_DATST|nr:hypothetical protein [Datura stramonium]